ncbi:hypothetical protein K443DRAFT_3924 [Laccaria amethystina LaAM-08-1]|uniref:Uncharacterized protein n=1 Tax=Laccaria amethystina LaAM-08-1 TaxID=1095629 RepID=A0A0C9XK99_9AGAR|nr:hypothetical protein K443DRAFT_3924 [Laccaria amethystina LaAM-08-1]
MPSRLDQFNLPRDFANFPMTWAEGQGIIECILEVTRKAAEWFAGEEYKTADMLTRRKKELSLRKMMKYYIWALLATGSGPYHFYDKL